ncbi:MAG: hypothetical protein EXQ49_00515 [Acidobacteria bacterium]|nr:hypothetical protein [Acidobacteriota bacterium]
MSLTAGQRIGPYEIVAPLGAGGMGEVYRARDSRLDRDVAIKVLPELFAQDPERLARFEREAKADMLVAAAEAAQARMRSEELERLVTFSQAVANALDPATLQ